MLVNGLPYFGPVGTVGRLLFGDGSAAAPSISFLNNPDTGFFRDTIDQIGITIGGAKRGYLTFASLGLGIYGIGGGNLVLGSAGAVELTAAGTNQNITLTPTGNGNVVVNNTTTTGILSIQGANAYSYVRYRHNDATIRWDVGYDGSNSRYIISDGTGNIWLSVVRSDGDTLFGTTTDSGNGRIQLATHTTSAGGIGFGTDTVIFRAAAGAIRISGTETTSTFQHGVAGRVEWSNSSGGGGAIRILTTGDIELRGGGVLGATVTAGGALRLANAAVAGAVVPTHTVTIQDVTGTTWRVPVLI